MSDNGTPDAGTDPTGQAEMSFDEAEIERAVLNESEEGRIIAAEFVALFGEFVTTHMRPMLRQAAADGREPQLLVNGLAELLRNTADSIEFPIGTSR